MEGSFWRFFLVARRFAGLRFAGIEYAGVHADFFRSGGHETENEANLTPSHYILQIHHKTTIRGS